MAGIIKKKYPHCKIYFFGRTYTKDVIALSEHVDAFINFDELEKLPEKEQIQVIAAYEADIFLHVFPKKKIAALAKAAKIPCRVGTTNRMYHWLTCNKLIKLSRKNSHLHEAQLNIKLLGFLNIESNIDLGTIPSFYGFTNMPFLEEQFNALIDAKKTNVILHPRSKGSAKEWGIHNFQKLIECLPEDKFKIFISGTKQDGETMREFIEKNQSVTDITGKLSLQQFIAFINNADALVAASTGPLHIAAALNKKAVGLFSPKRPIHPGRWMPLGTKAQVLVSDENCERCAKKQECNCITNISPAAVAQLLNCENNG